MATLATELAAAIPAECAGAVATAGRYGNAEPSSRPDKAKAQLLRVKADPAVAVAGKNINYARSPAASERFLSALPRN